MIKRTLIRKFVADHIAPHFPDFGFDLRGDLSRVCRPFLHGICFEQSEDDTFYVTCFVHFLSKRSDFIAIGFGERMRRNDRYGESWRTEPSEGEAALLLGAMRGSRYSPFNLHPTSKAILALADPDVRGPHSLFGLAHCAIFENDARLATEFMRLAKSRFKGVTLTESDRLLLAEITEIEDGLDDLVGTQRKLKDWVEESIHLLKLEKISPPLENGEAASFEI